MMLKKAIGGTLRQLRTANGLTLRQLSNSTCISLGHLSEVEIGKKEISSELLNVILKTYGLDTEELVKEIYEYITVHNSRSNKRPVDFDGSLRKASA